MCNVDLNELKKPFPVSSIKWRIGQKNKDKTKAMMLCYIDARDVMDRLDEVCGTNWSDSYKEVNGRIVCNITIDGISREDGAGDTDFEGEKGGLSDAFKRAAVKWGIGRYLYNAREYNTWVACKGMADWEVYKNNKGTLDVVAEKLSGSNKTPAEKAKETREANIKYYKGRVDKLFDWLKSDKKKWSYGIEEEYHDVMKWAVNNKYRLEEQDEMIGLWDSLEKDKIPY